MLFTRIAGVPAVALSILICLAQAQTGPSPERVEADEEHWVGTWSAAPAESSGAMQYADQTLRLIAHNTIGGRRVRVRISNTFGKESLSIGAARIAIRNTGASIVPSTDRPLSFSGKFSFVIPAGALVISDPVDLEVPPLKDLAVSI
jgi:hypothetical protein